MTHLNVEKCVKCGILTLYNGKELHYNQFQKQLLLEQALRAAK